MFDITPIVKLLFSFLGLVITTVLVPYLRSRTTAQEQAVLLTLIKAAVTAAEQIYRDHGQGKFKKAYVIGWLEERGIRIDSNELDALIESAVFELNNAALPGIVLEADSGSNEEG